MNIETESLWLNNLVKKLETLANPDNSKKLAYETGNYQAIINKLMLAERSVISQRRQDLLSQLIKIRHKLQYPILSLMEYDFHENTHSNILEYLFSTEYGHKFGKELLASFVDGLDEERKHSDIIQWILDGEYSIYREHHIGNGRIDLLIKDNNKRFTIVIENKTLSGIHETYDETQKVFINQLQKYYTPFAKENAVFILLSYRDITEAVHPKYNCVSYSYLLAKLNEIEDESDNILREYRLQLQAILTPGFRNAKELLTLLIRLTNEPDSIENLGIYTLQLLKGYINEIG